MKKKLWLNTLLFCILLLVPISASAKGSVRGLVISGRNICDENARKMHTSLCDNKIPVYETKAENIKSFYFEAESDEHTSVKAFNEQIKSAFSKSKSSDLNVFYYTGHFAQNGVALEMNALTKATKQGILFEDLAKTLAKYKGKYIVILDACFARGFYTKGISKLDKKDQKRFLCLTAADPWSPSYVFPGVGDLFSNRVMEGIGYALEYGIPGSTNEFSTLNADDNMDGAVSVREIYRHTYQNRTILQTPYLDGGISSNLTLFQFAYVKLDKSQATLEEEDDYVQLNATVYRDGGIKRTVQWKSSNNKIATVNNGKVVAKKAGTVTITAYLADSSGKMCLGSEAVCEVTVKTSIELDKTEITLCKGEKASINAETNFSSKRVQWKSAKDKIAAVKETKKNSAIITAKKVGKTKITAYIGKVKASCTVIVKKPTINLNKTSLNLTEEETETLVAVVRGKSSTVRWKSSDDSIASVNKDGKVYAKKKGTAVITATANGVSTKCKVVVNHPILSMPSTMELFVGESSVIETTVIGKESKITWKLNDTSIAQVDVNGKVTAIKEGTTIITASANGVEAKCQVTVKQGKGLEEIDLVQYLDLDYDDGLKKLKSDCGNNTDLYKKASICLSYNNGKIGKVAIDKVYSVDGIANGDNSVNIAGFYKGMRLNEINAVIISGGWKKIKSQSMGDSLIVYYSDGTYRVRLYVMSGGTLLQVSATAETNASELE